MTPEMQAAMRLLVNREIDAETARRTAGWQPPQPREPEPVQVAAPTAREAAMSPEASASWNSWARAAIDQRVHEIFIPAIGEAIGMKGNELRAEFKPAIAAVKAEVAEQLQQQIADSVRDYSNGALAPLRAEIEELKSRLVDAEAKLAAATGERAAAPLALLPGRWSGTA